jgi:hypothetical protein
MNGIPSLAQSVQSQGRGNDTQLVHMTPREVQGLESLAMAYGGSLTTNPRTGLKEAGFLDNILPTLAGAALTIGTGGVINPMTAGLIVGGGTGLLTGNFEKGLMAGFGAFGGAGLGGALAGTGAATAAGAGSAGNAASSAFQAAQSNIDPLLLEGMSAQQVASTLPASTQAGLASQGIQALGSEAGRSAFMNQVGGLRGLAKYGGAAVAPALLGGEQGGIQPDAGTMRPYSYDPGRQTDQPGFQYRTGAPGESTSEQQYFTPTFTPLPTFTPGSGSAAELEDERRRMGVMGLAEGGEVEDPSKMGLKQIFSGALQSGAGPAELAKRLAIFSGATPALAAGSQGPVRMLRGGGDATSDSMNGVIDGEEPVRLATGEVVIDGRAVSEIGNGDNESGAKKIEAAIDRIHKIRQRAKRGKPSSADKTFASMIA